MTGRWVAGLLGSWVLALYVWAPSSATQQPGYAAASLCAPAAQLVHIEGVAEASGVAVGRRTPGLLWTHNDSGAPLLYAIDTAGAVKARVQVTGAQVDDWEDIASGPCPGGACLYIADIGDNNRSRRSVTVYRIPEPRPDQAASEPAESWTLTYPDGAHDAEALFVAAGALFIVTKDDSRGTALYRMPLLPKGGRAARLELVSRPSLERVTGAAISPDEAWVALRTNDALMFYRTPDLVGGGKPAPRRFDATPIGEPQGEGVALGSDGRVYLTGEGGGRGGTLASLRCTLR